MICKGIFFVGNFILNKLERFCLRCGIAIVSMQLIFFIVIVR